METTLRLSHVKSLISDIVKYFCKLPGALTYRDT